MYYGGRLLSNVTLDNTITENLIPLIKLNSNAYVVMDRDGEPSQTELNSTKKRIIREIGEENVWVTEGEVENYLSKEVLGKWLSEKYKITNNLEMNNDEKLEDIITQIDPDVQ